MMDTNYFNSMVLDANDIYLTSRGWNGIFRYSLLEDKMEVCDNEICTTISSEEKMVAIANEMVILLPAMGKTGKIEFINKNTNTLISQVDIADEVYFDNYYIHENIMYVINNWYKNPSVYVIDLKCNRVIKIIYLSKFIKKEYQERTCRPLACDIVIQDGNIVLAHNHSLISISLLTNDIETTDIDCTIGCFVAIGCEKGNYWIIDKCGNGIKWNNNIIKGFDIKKEVKELVDTRSKDEHDVVDRVLGYTESYQLFNHIYCQDGCVWFIPGRADALVRLDLDKNEWNTEIKITDDLIKDRSLCNSKCSEENAIVFIIPDDKFLIINNKGLQIHKTKIKLCNSKKIKYGMICESKRVGCSLEEFISGLGE